MSIRQLEAMLTGKYFGDWKGNGRLAPSASLSAIRCRPRAAIRRCNPVGQTRVMVEPDLARAVTYA
jgi:hypothetical protein